MKHLITLFFLLNIAAASYAQCDYTEYEKDDEKKMIALAAKGKTEALDIYAKKVIVEKNKLVQTDLETVLGIWFYEKWEDDKKILKPLRKKYDGLKKDLERVENDKEPKSNGFKTNFWVKEKKLPCMISILNKLQSKADTYYGKPRKERKKQTQKKNEDLRNANAEATVKPSISKPDTIKTTPQPDSSSNSLQKENQRLKQEIAILKHQLKRYADSTDYSFLPSEKTILKTLEIHFNEGEIKLDNEDIKSITNLSEFIKTNFISEIIIEGFASQTGTREENFAISMSRCYQVKNQIIASSKYQNGFAIYPYGETDKPEFRTVIITLKGIKKNSNI